MMPTTRNRIATRRGGVAIGAEVAFFHFPPTLCTLPGQLRGLLQGAEPMASIWDYQVGEEVAVVPFVVMSARRSHVHEAAWQLSNQAVRRPGQAAGVGSSRVSAQMVPIARSGSGRSKLRTDPYGGFASTTHAWRSASRSNIAEADL